MHFCASISSNFEAIKPIKTLQQVIANLNLKGIIFRISGTIILIKMR